MVAENVMLVRVVLFFIFQGKITKPASEFDMDKVRTTLKQFVRDWSTEGAVERSACYTPVINDIMERFPYENW
jgi:hypothetical protein